MYSTCIAYIAKAILGFRMAVILNIDSANEGVTEGDHAGQLISN